MACLLLRVKQKIFGRGSAERIIAEAEKYLPYYQDDLSREILNARIEYLRTHDINIFMNIALNEGWTSRSLYIAGKHSREYSGILAVYDSEGRMTEYMKRFAELLRLKIRLVTVRDFLRNGYAQDDELIALIVGKWHWNLCRNNVKNYMASHNIHSSFTMLPVVVREDKQYVDVFSPNDGEIIVDAGAYTGDTALRFLKWGGDKVRHVYSFEFDPLSIAGFEENTRPYADKVTLIRKGTWDVDTVSSAETSCGLGSNINPEGSTKVQLASIDSELADVPVTFIKMDVEGAELKSLMGAKNTIVKNHPRLAICVYHKPEDISEIPGYILSLVPEYKFCLRHYASNNWETVLYAYCE